MMDAVDVIVHGLRSLLLRNPDVFRRTFRRGQVFNNETRGIRCDREPVVPWVHGRVIRAHLLAVNFTGVTGPVTFDPLTGQRSGHRLDVMALRFDAELHKVNFNSFNVSLLFIRFDASVTSFPLNVIPLFLSVRLRYPAVYQIQFDMSELNGTVHSLTTLYITISKLLRDVCYVCYCIDRVLSTSYIFNRIYVIAFYCCNCMF